jgi:6-pyruvoyltetrahydropterin/6-carboxytetrahydropterin synthase
MVTCTRRLEFDYGHRVHRHESKCRHLHGHRGVVEVTAVAPLDSLGRVIDFSVLKKLVGGWIDEYWDHNMVIFDEDTEALKAVRWVKDGKEPFAAPFNPTAENMAKYLLEVVCPEVLKDTGVQVIKIKFYETVNGMAEATL